MGPSNVLRSFLAVSLSWIHCIHCIQSPGILPRTDLGYIVLAVSCWDLSVLVSTKDCEWLFHVGNFMSGLVCPSFDEGLRLAIACFQKASNSFRKPISGGSDASDIFVVSESILLLQISGWSDASWSFKPIFEIIFLLPISGWSDERRKCGC